MEYSAAWLNYHQLSTEKKTPIVILHQDLRTAKHIRAIEELTLGLSGLYGRQVVVTDNEEVYHLGVAGIHFQLIEHHQLGDEGFSLMCKDGKCTLGANVESGLLYGVFELLRYIQAKAVTDFDTLNYCIEKRPSNPLRMLNHWDNMDGSIERGYSGKSFSFSEDNLLLNERTHMYARMIASVGINGVTINNVNVKGTATELISKRYYEQLNRMAILFASYGIKLFLSINFAAPMELGGLDLADPCDEQVISWWIKKSQEVWENIPELGGFLVKADSEGRPGPFTYGRTQADGANMLAKAVEPFGGLIIWRCFVYNCQQDWRDTKTDRAKAGYDYFMPMDGQFADNVVLQIKNGPMDFQVREPISPLFGGLKRTNMMLEVQIAQEYTGQQRHLCYLIPWFKEILQFNTYCKEQDSTIEDIICGRTYANTYGGIAAVANMGNDFNWTGHDLAAANLYGFGRLAFETELTAEEIAYEWIVQTLGHNQRVIETCLHLLMKSWLTYEKYTSPLGIGWMVKPNTHYGPDVDGYEYDRWGTYHKADHRGLGVDRTASGTGFCSQYNEPIASHYADKTTCPQELLLFFHYVEYSHVLSSGKTVLQHIYDTHFEGAHEAEQFLEQWQALKPQIEEDLYLRTLERFLHQKHHAREWCDVINSYFYRKTGIEDQQGRPLF